MLQKLFIQNYAIINELEIEFSGNLNVITGETGAGKSIIAGALGLILGERADSTALVDKEKKCIVEGIFNAEGKKEIKNFLAENEFDAGDELIVRREISTYGKSRAFINDTPVTLSQLNALGSLLVDLHQQFDTFELNKSDFQREVLDALAGHADIVEDYKSVFIHLKNEKEELEKLKEQKQQFDKEADYNKFQHDELEEVDLKENELEEIDSSLKIMSNAEGIKGALAKVFSDLQESESPMIQQLKMLSNQLQQYSSLHPELAVLIQRLQSAQIELQDIAGEVDRINSHVYYNPDKMEQLSERLSTGYKLLKKHGVQTTGELLEIKKQLFEKLQAVFNIDESIQKKEKKVNDFFNHASQLAAKISEGRKKQTRPLEEKVNRLLKQVGMPNAKLKVELKNVALNSYGTDEAEFLFNANIPAGQPGESNRFQALRKVASGGELNRLMLCIKSLVAQSIDLPTLIFDEIDSGISGEAARQIGIIMKEIAFRRQVVSITHQPQIAGKADAHFFVYKEIVKNTVRTNIRLLTIEERITTIARMLSGEKPTAAAIENAREMVMN